LSKGVRLILPSYQDLQRILKELLRDLGRTYIVLDALDECKETELGQLMDLIAMLRGWTDSPLHLFITSQPRILFTKHFEKITCIPLESKVIQNDIRLFVENELVVNLELKIWASRAEDVTDQVVSKSNGMSVSSLFCTTFPL
jgi:hypothetical protein